MDPLASVSRLERVANPKMRPTKSRSLPAERLVPDLLALRWQELLPQVKRMLIFTTFRPAMSMGRPISSRAVLSFSRISVRG